MYFEIYFRKDVESLSLVKAKKIVYFCFFSSFTFCDMIVFYEILSRTYSTIICKDAFSSHSGRTSRLLRALSP